MTDMEKLTAPWQEPALSGTIAQGDMPGDKICITEEHIQKPGRSIPCCGNFWPGSLAKAPAGAPW